MSDNKDAYRKFALFYRPLLKARGHFERQFNILMELFSMYGVRPNARILDAACGTGDVLSNLFTAGYIQISGIDGSEYMIKQTTTLSNSQHIPMQVCHWQDLSSYFSNQGRFDLVFILGHALPHAKIDEIPKVFEDIYKGLQPNGLFIFDIRTWTRNEHGFLIEADRPIGKYIPLGKIEVEGREYEVDNCYTYKNGRQYSTYWFRRISANKGASLNEVEYDLEDKLEVSYTLFDSNEATLWLDEIGFQNINIIKFPIWPYLVIAAQRV